MAVNVTSDAWFGRVGPGPSRIEVDGSFGSFMAKTLRPCSYADSRHGCMDGWEPMDGSVVKFDLVEKIRTKRDEGWAYNTTCGLEALKQLERASFTGPRPPSQKDWWTAFQLLGLLRHDPRLSSESELVKRISGSMAKHLTNHLLNGSSLISTLGEVVEVVAEFPLKPLQEVDQAEQWSQVYWTCRGGFRGNGAKLSGMFLERGGKAVAGKAFLLLSRPSLSSPYPRPLECWQYLEKQHLANMGPLEFVNLLHCLAQAKVPNAQLRPFGMPKQTEMRWNGEVAEEIASLLPDRLRGVFKPQEVRSLEHLGSCVHTVLSASRQMEIFHWPLLETCIECIWCLAQLNWHDLFERLKLPNPALAALSSFLFSPTEPTPALSELYEAVKARPSQSRIKILHNWVSVVARAARRLVRALDVEMENPDERICNMQCRLMVMSAMAMTHLDMKTVTSLLTSIRTVARRYPTRLDASFIQSAVQRGRALASNCFEEDRKFQQALAAYLRLPQQCGIFGKLREELQAHLADLRAGR
ncbi:unnamed protein product [Symbiodinium sp. CCMP2592]|nr:unnamed protein product [Symbiodinium sp. CCMP2592]